MLLCNVFVFEMMIPISMKLPIFTSLICSAVLLSACQQIQPAQFAPSISVSNVVPPLEDASSQLVENQYKGKDRPSIALVLGSGGARGYAHIGVIEILEQQGIRPDFIVGTSAGSIVGSIYASGKSAAELRQIALNLQVADVREFNIGLQGFFDGAKVENYVNKQVGQKPLEQLPIPMYVVATELKNGHLKVFNRGNTGQAVRASISIPSMFIPTPIAGREYVDGGLVSPVPVNVAKQLGADVVIAVDILAQPKHTETSNVWGMFNQNINIMQNKIALYELKNADVVIQPDLREKAHIFDVKGREMTINAGKQATLVKLGQIQAVMQNRTKLYNQPQLANQDQSR